MTSGEKIEQIQNLIGAVPDRDWGPKSQAALDALAKAARAEKQGIPPPATATPTAQFDKRTEGHLAKLDPKAVKTFRDWLVQAKQVAAQFGCEYLAIASFRSGEEQDRLYAQGRTLPGPVVTKARGWQSYHNYGLALDMGVFRGGKYLDDTEPATADKIHREAGRLAVATGLMEWGGNFSTIKDYPHFQLKTGLSLSEMKARYQKSGTVL